MSKNIAIIGCSGAIGSAFLHELNKLYPDSMFHAFSSNYNIDNISNITYHNINYYDEGSIANAAAIASEKGLIDIVIIAVGALYNDYMMPEKSLKDLSSKQFKYFFESNTIIPALLIKHFVTKLTRDNISIIAALSARVGSISDNNLGGWYSYRASKAALNMVIKNSAIEVRRTRKNAIIVGLHPGTVDSDLSRPFQKNIPIEKIFSADFSVKKLIQILDNLTSEDSGKCFAWDGDEIKP